MIADFKVRNKNKVTEVEAEQYLKRRMTKYIRYGLDHLDSELPIYKIPALIRSAPDYIVFNKYNDPLFFEAKGFKGFVKLKIKDLSNYAKWNAHMQIIFFLYNVEEKTFCEIMFNEIVKIIERTKPIIKAYPENPNNKYYEILIKDLPDFTNF